MTNKCIGQRGRKIKKKLLFFLVMKERFDRVVYKNISKEERVTWQNIDSKPLSKDFLQEKKIYTDRI